MEIIIPITGSLIENKILNQKLIVFDSGPNLKFSLISRSLIKVTSPGGLEPPTFRLTVERANQLRHGDIQSLNGCIQI